MFKPSERLGIIFSLLEKVEVFADIGADHGYVAEAMLKADKCERAIVTDISAKCLKKAEENLSKNFEGRYISIVTDGLKGVPFADEVLIAGMGGELISDIISSADFLPEIFVIQPMKNTDSVRRTLIKSGYKFVNDYTFKDKKFYDVIKARRGSDSYSEEEIEFGRDNLRDKSAAFREMIEIKRSKLFSALQYAENKEVILEEIAKLDKVLQ